MNRATKRLLAKQQAAEERTKQQRRQALAQAAPKVKEPLRKRLPRFVREVRVELKKVNWPSRQEVFVYTVVVLVSVTFVTLFVFGLDYGFGRLVLRVFGR